MIVNVVSFFDVILEGLQTALFWMAWLNGLLSMNCLTWLNWSTLLNWLYGLIWIELINWLWIHAILWCWPWSMEKMPFCGVDHDWLKSSCRFVALTIIDWKGRAVFWRWPSWDRLCCFMALAFVSYKELLHSFVQVILFQKYWYFTADSDFARTCRKNISVLVLMGFRTSSLPNRIHKKNKYSLF